jgi:peptidoglycan/xylan/chitin deacetylase (PgdA/CDA1 family)
MVNKNKIPILMYHGVADNTKTVPYAHLLQPTYQFERCIRYLSDKRFATISLYDLYFHIKFNKPIPERSIVLTFDDGYLDNWVFVYPILKQYHMKATIFINPDFIDPITTYRPNLDDVKIGKVAREDLKWWGYLSWEEIRKMINDEVVDIQNHSLTHTWYFKSDHIVDFHYPGDKYYWLTWNRWPEKKHKWLEDIDKELIEYGTPVYDYGRSLGIRRYYEDRKLTNYVATIVKSEGGRQLFNRAGWREILYKGVEYYRRHNVEDSRYETVREYHGRLETEVIGSKAIIESHLNKRIDFLCWPGGVHTTDAYELALESGYLSTTNGIRKNQFGSDPTRLHRIGPYLHPRKYKWSVTKNTFLPVFILQIKSYRGDGGYDFLRKLCAAIMKKGRAIVRP